MSYVDGFVIPLPKNNLAMYRKMAKLGRDTWMKNGAVAYYECIGDDLTPEGVAFTFPKMAKTKPDETVVFAFIVFKSRKHRDAVNKKVMAIFAKDTKKMEMPFDMKRFAYAGFTTLIEG